MKSIKKTAMISLLLILMFSIITGTAVNAIAVEEIGSATSRTVIGDASDGALPASFDLRHVDTDGDGMGDRCYVTPVKAQQPFGVCWSFASVAAAEISLLGSVYADDPDAYKTLDLSEKQVAYFSHMYIDDPSHPQYGEGMHTDEYNDASDIYGGGSAYLAMNTFAAGIGPTNESRAEIYEFHGKNKETTQKQSAAGLVTCYSPNDDWSMDDDCRYQRDYIIKESYLLETPAKFNIDFQNMTTEYAYDEAATNAMKEQLLQKRGIVIGFHADTSLPWQTGAEGEYMDAKTWAHYTWDQPVANHAVTIVGWDDNYPASSFLTGHQPPADGAWLVKNSWGSGMCEFPNEGTGQWGIPVQKTDENGNPVYDESGEPVMVGSGYFWLSYYDHTIKDPEVFIFDTQWHSSTVGEDAMDSVHLDQHDLMPVGGLIPALSNNVLKSANIFTPENGEHIVYVSYVAKEPNTTVSYEVYLLAPDYTSPTDGVLMASGERTHELGGFYLEELNPYVTVKKGQSYSIVITQKTANGAYAVNAPANNGKNAPKMPDQLADMVGSQYAVAVVNEGESMLYTDGEWMDWSKDTSRERFFGSSYSFSKQMDAQFDNFPIKGFAIDKMIQSDLRLTDSVEALSLFEGESKTIGLELYGADDGIELSDLSVEWSAAPGAEEIIDVTLSDGGQKATVSALNPGKTYLTATAGGAGTVVIPVVINTVGILGDANLDGEVDITDATTIQRYDIKMIDLSEEAKRLADVDLDGDVCILDTTWIQRWLVDLPSKEDIGKPII